MEKTCKFNKLRGRIYEKFVSTSDFASAIKKDKSAVSLMLNGKRKFKLEDITQFCEALDIKPEEVADYFFV